MIVCDIPKRFPFVLAGKLIFPEEGVTRLSVHNKYTGDLIAEVPMASKEILDNALKAAVDSQRECAMLPVYKRKKALIHCVTRFKEEFDKMAYVTAMEGGKPIKDARGEVSRLIDTFEIAAEECSRVYGEYSRQDFSERNHGLVMVTKRVPIGVIAMIAPFNFPLNLAAHKIAPAIAAGCPFVLKPASLTPIGALIIGAILSECDLPSGSFSILPCQRDAADILVVDDRPALLSFTGSPDVGWSMKNRASKKKVTLELGGNAACIVDGIPKEGLDHLINRIIFGAYYNCGQSCISTQRLFVHASIYEKVKEHLICHVKSLRVGDPLEEDTFVGPMISKAECTRLRNWVDESISVGLPILAISATEIQKENLFLPVLLEVTEETHCTCSLWNEEAFGPVLLMKKYTDFKKCVEEVNDSKFGIHVGIFSQNMDHVMYGWDHLETGGVIVNDVPSIRSDAMPYGGVKDSGLGREGIRSAIEDMTEVRTLMMRNVGLI